MLHLSRIGGGQLAGAIRGDGVDAPRGVDGADHALSREASRREWGALLVDWLAKR
jgi:hypothetical protein